MSFYKEVENASGLNDQVPALESYLPNSIIYITLYCLAVPPNILLAYMGLKKGLISARVKYPTLGMTIANLYGLFGYLMLNLVYLIMLFGDIKLSLFLCSFLRTVIYNTTYVIYFLFPVLAIDQWLLICHNCDLSIKTLTTVILTCFVIPMLVAIYDLCLQDVLLYDFIFAYIRMSPYTNVVSSSTSLQSKSN
uniref:G_PROTEIN_RECEP_F1_2 domain-containing protein n=1 Tax=Elaeophora elaphi TaxID=1147741 RepID=A0A0R3RRU7_9BILA